MSISGAATSASRLFKDIDADADGAVTRRELSAYFAAHGREPKLAAALFAALAADGDGLLEYDEFKTLYQACKLRRLPGATLGPSPVGLPCLFAHMNSELNYVPGVQARC